LKPYPDTLSSHQTQSFRLPVRSFTNRQPLDHAANAYPATGVIDLRERKLRRLMNNIAKMNTNITKMFIKSCANFILASK